MYQRNSSRLIDTLLIALLLHTASTSADSSSNDIDKQKTVLGSDSKPPAGEDQQTGYGTCPLNDRSSVVCGMCAEIFHQMTLEEQDGGNNIAASECCESGEIYELCTYTLRQLMEAREEEQKSDADQWIDPLQENEVVNNDEYQHSDVTQDDVIQSLNTEYSTSEKRANPFLGKRGNPFLGKRANPFLGKRDTELDDKRAYNPFLGKRAFLGKNRMNPFLGKRAMNPFLGKRGMNPFLGKKAMNPFLGKRAMNPFLGKRAMNPFLGKRVMNPFLGKKAMNPFLGKRVMNPFLGKRAYNPFLG